VAPSAWTSVRYRPRVGVGHWLFVRRDVKRISVRPAAAAGAVQRRRFKLRFGIHPQRNSRQRWLGHRPTTPSRGILRGRVDRDWLLLDQPRWPRSFSSSAR